MDSYVVAGVSRRHGSVLANDDVNLTVGRAEVFGLLGPNGAGKTTLVRQLVGLIAPDAGSISLFGQPLDRRRVAGTVGYLPQGDAALADLTVSLAIETTARLRGLSHPATRTATSALLDELALTPIADRTIGKLSGGQRRLAAVATALVADRPLLVLDEPTAGLDSAARRAVWAAVERRRADHGTTVVLVTHNVLEAETVLDRVAVLDTGRVIACDTPGRLKAQVASDVRLDLVWRSDPPLSDPAVARLAETARVTGRRWSVRLPVDEARALLGHLTSGPAFAALDDFTLATPSLEDVYLALGGTAADLERS